VCGALPIDALDVRLILRVLEPIWQDKPETAKRLRGRLETVIDWATTRGYRLRDNPARWKGHLENLLPKREKLRAVKHHPALPYREIAGFVADLRQHDDAGARVLELVILTGARSNEVLQAPWREFDRPNRLWTIPAERMKKGEREHRVPLSDAAMAILDKQDAVGTNDYLFPGCYGAKHVGQNLLLQTLRRLGRTDLKAHSFRSTFRDWVAEQTNFPNEVAEMALSHAVGNRVEAAYRCGDLFDRRRQLMAAWASYISGAEVLSFLGVR
jgi:integrase